MGYRLFSCGDVSYCLYMYSNIIRNICQQISVKLVDSGARINIIEMKTNDYFCP